MYLSVKGSQDYSNRSRRESNPHLRFRKPLFYPLNYGNNDICDFRFAIADCKWRRRAGAERWWSHLGEAPCEMIMPEHDSHTLTVCPGLMRD
jgi:hypothetical protein